MPDDKPVDIVPDSWVQNGDAPAPKPDAAAKETGPAPEPGDDAEQPDKQAQPRQGTRWRDEYFKLLDQRNRDAEAIRELALRSNSQQAAKPSQNDWKSQNRAPTEADFPGDYEAYLGAMVEHRAEQVVAKREQAARQTQAQQAEERRRSEFRERLDKGAEKYPDFEAVALSENVHISPAVAQAMATSEFFPDLAYHLGKNPSEAARISALDPVAAAREIGKLEIRFAETTQAAEQRTTTAPAPVRTVTGKSPATVADDKLPIDEWMARENERMAKKRNMFRR